MITQLDFDQLTELAMREGGRSHMRPVIQKELLHYDILYSLEQAGLLQKLTFQGGTSLRLCYGANRFSEDLDFVGGRHFNRQHLEPIAACIETYIGQRYGLEISVKEPKDLRLDREYADIKVDKWQVSIVTAPAHKHVPRQRIKIEVANIDAYSRTPRALQANYSFLPDGYADTLVLTESLDEIMADKLISLVNTQSYVRNRDIWDLRWLAQQGAKIRVDWVRKKVVDYHIDLYEAKLDQLISRLPTIIYGEAFYNELSRFIPQTIAERTLNRPEFLDFLLQESVNLFSNLKSALGVDQVHPKFEL